jgi:hypothetical protein
MILAKILHGTWCIETVGSKELEGLKALFLPQKNAPAVACFDIRTDYYHVTLYTQVLHF